MNLKILFFSIGTIFLSHCVSMEYPPIAPKETLSIKPEEYCDDFGYCISLPLSSKHAIGEENLPVFYSNNGDQKFILQPHHPPHKTHCEQRFGSDHISKARQVDSSFVVWWKVERGWDIADQEPYCFLTNGYDNTPLMGLEAYHSSYELCAGKGEKTIYICFRQVTDNPELADQIFSTFRWTK